MLYDNDDYLNGLDHSVHKEIEYFYPNVCLFSRLDYESAAHDFQYTSHYSYSLECLQGDIRCKIDNPYCYSNPYLPGDNHYPPEPEISKLWHVAKQECNITDKLDIKPDNDCLNERFGRSDELAGEEKCRMYYFWRFEVKSRACMIKNAKFEELDKYKICGEKLYLAKRGHNFGNGEKDDAFLCTKDSIAYKQKLIEEAELRHQQEEEARKRAEAEKEEARKILYSNETILALAKQLRHEETIQYRLCKQNHECYPQDMEKNKNDTVCKTYDILEMKVKSKICMEKFAINEELNLYDNCSIHGFFICLKGDFEHYKSLQNLICQAVPCVR